MYNRYGEEGAERMNTDERAKGLHDRSTRGMPLTEAEQAELDAWYAEQDALESVALAADRPPESVSELRAQVEHTRARLASVGERIQAVSDENESIRAEIVRLQALLSQQPAAPQT
jgi:hypothetical protein